MPWKDKQAQRLAFVTEVSRAGVNISKVCAKYGITRRTGYKWLSRFKELGIEGLQDRSRRPHTSPNQTAAEVEDLIIALRNTHPAWGAVTLKDVLEKQGHQHIPSASTITQILHRHGKISTAESVKRTRYQRFEREKPNELWQMDFKGEFLMTNGQYCFPLTVIDDHSRYLLGVRACENVKYETTKRELTVVFREYGLPDSMLMDNGAPWGVTAGGRFTIFGVWLLRLGVYTVHGRKHHPQTQGKVERLHRTMEAELLSQQNFHSLEACQLAFDQWRIEYNHERPHRALEMRHPVDRYHPSRKSLPEHLPGIEYGDAEIRKVDAAGKFSYRNITFYLGKGFRGEYVAIQPTEAAGYFSVLYDTWKVALCSTNDRSCSRL